MKNNIWHKYDNTNSQIKTIPTDICIFNPSSDRCKQVIVVERMVQDENKTVYSAIGKGIYKLY